MARQGAGDTPCHPPSWPRPTSPLQRVPQFSFFSLHSLASSHFPNHLREEHPRFPVLLNTMARGGQHTEGCGQHVMAQPTRGLTKDQEVLLDSWLPLLRAREMAVRQAARQLGFSEGLVARALGTDPSRRGPPVCRRSHSQRRPKGPIRSLESPADSRHEYNRLCFLR